MSFKDELKNIKINDIFKVYFFLSFIILTAYYVVKLFRFLKENILVTAFAVLIISLIGYLITRKLK